MISKVKTNMRAAAVNTLTARIIEMYRTNGALAADPFLANTVNRVEVRNIDLTTAIRQDKVLSALEEADLRRDAPGRALFHFSRAYLLLDDFATSAPRYAEVLGKYGARIFDAAQDEETAYIDSLLQDLKAPEMSGVVSALPGVEKAVERLREAQEAYKRSKAQYAQTVAGEAARSTASEIRKEIVALLNTTLFPYVDALMLSNPGVYGAFAEAIDLLVDEANALIARRATIKAKPDGGGTPPPAENPASNE